MISLDLDKLVLSGKMKKRGRPKGSYKTVIGLLTKKIKRSSEKKKTVPFLQKKSIEREKSMHAVSCFIYYFIFLVILHWFVDPDVADAALFQKELIQEDAVEVQPHRITAFCVDEKICLYSCKKYFSNDAWMAVMNVVETVKNNPLWYC